MTIDKTENIKISNNLLKHNPRYFSIQKNIICFYILPIHTSMEAHDLVSQWNATEDKTQLVNTLISERKYKASIKNLLEEKADLLEKYNYNHIQITNLQSESKEIQREINKVNTVLNSLYNHLPNLNNTETEDENVFISNKEIENLENNENFEKDLILNFENIENNENKENKKEKNVKTNKENKNIARDMRLRRKLKLIKSIKDELVPKSDFANRVEKWRIQDEIRRYDRINFGGLEVVSSIDLPDSVTSFKLKLMTNDILRVKFDPTASKSFHRAISILKYLDKCDLVPRLLHFDNSKLTIFMPYYGRLMTKKNPDNLLGLLLRKLKRNWGVYLLKNGQIQNTIPAHSGMINSQKRVWLYDFSSPDWVVDRDRPYPMIN